MKDKNNNSLFNEKDINKIFKQAINKAPDNPDKLLPPSAYLDDNKILKKTKKR